MSKQQKKKGKPSDPRAIKLSQHPRAQRQIRKAKSWGGLAGCLLAAYASWHGGAPFVDTALRAVLWGIVAYVVVWACAQQIWRQLAVAELRAAERRLIEAQRRAEEEAMRALPAEVPAERAVPMPGGP